MKRIFSTSELHPRDRFDFWHSVACKSIVGHDAEPESRLTFAAELQSGTLADVSLVVFQTSSMSVSHGYTHAAQAKDDELFVCLQLAGRLALEQGGCEIVQESGDFTLLDPRLPYSGKFSADSKLLVLKVPRRALEARIGRAQQMILRPVRPVEAESSLTSAFLTMLPAHSGGLSQEAAEMVKDQALDLLAVSLSRTMEGQKLRVSSARSVVLMQVRAAIEARLADPALDAAAVAAAAGVSVRYANAALAQEGTSISRLILARRLARCRKALGDPHQAHRTVSEIAYAWGFSDMTHFGRAFKAAFGLLPSEYRSSSKGD